MSLFSRKHARNDSHTQHPLSSDEDEPQYFTCCFTCCSPALPAADMLYLLLTHALPCCWHAALLVADMLLPAADVLY